VSMKFIGVHNYIKNALNEPYRWFIFNIRYNTKLFLVQYDNKINFNFDYSDKIKSITQKIEFCYLRKHLTSNIMIEIIGKNFWNTIHE